MKIKNRRYIIAIDKNEYNFLDTVTFDNGKPRYFKDKKSAINFLKKIYEQNDLEFNPFIDDGVDLLWIN